MLLTLYDVRKLSPKCIHMKPDDTVRLQVWINLSKGRISVNFDGCETHVDQLHGDTSNVACPNNPLK